MNTLKNQYLREMGVDVWVLRKRAMPQVVAAEPVRELAPAKTSPAPQAVPRNTAPAPEFHLCFMTWPEVSLVFSLPLDADVIDTAHRRFAEDVGIALRVTGDAAIGAVRWPMVRSAHIDQSESAARAVMRQRVEQCAERVVVFGEAAADWLGDTLTRQVVAARDMDSYIAEPLAKRELWQSLLSMGV
ncbi:MAG TPA: hypothetical protein VJ998_00545, partial [Pseudomonadales bacterium]|nr:hypothetical protein [Pseudomonadales bacterium]